MERKNYRIGLSCAIGCAVVWGFLPIYWNALKPIDSGVIIFYRVALMPLVCFLASLCKERSLRAVFAPLIENKKSMLLYFVAGIIITINWSIYIWAVNAGHLIQCSMGYFLEPLVVCIFGIVVYKERVNGWKKLSMLLALCGLLVMIIGYKQIPLIAVGLGLSFAVYAAVKKSVDLSPLQSLLYETMFLVPAALGFILYYETSGMGALVTGGGFKFFLLMFAGIATAVPMGLFSFAANKLPLITVGLTEYISPSISLVLGIFLFREPFDVIQFSAFVVIWIGLAFFTYGEVIDSRAAAQEKTIKGENE
ncbi:EamA family transporter RarD [Ihubacter sp. mB4P-1]|uniref:EamA family transporter RarD n=1 Tax=Ihubacter sp. mB4P-1 TaxID=3242370 RepID=UPI00137B4240